MLAAVQNLQQQYDNALDNAVEDAMFETAEQDSGREVVINKEEVVERFFNGFYNNMGAMDNPGFKNQLRFYIPFVAIVEREGFWLFLHREKTDGTEEMGFSNQQKYLWEDGNYEIAFTLTDDVTVCEKKSGEWLSGDYRDVRKIYPAKVLEEELFDLTRRNTIITLLTNEFTKAINGHNRIAETYGISYEFSLPVIAREDWYNTMDDIGMVVLFQGYPFGIPSMGYYNRVALSGARIRKNFKITDENLQSVW